MATDDEKLDMIAGIAKTHHTWMEYGLQTANDETLRTVHRGHDVASFDRATMAFTDPESNTGSKANTTKTP